MASNQPPQQPQAGDLPVATNQSVPPTSQAATATSTGSIVGATSTPASTGTTAEAKSPTEETENSSDAAARKTSKSAQELTDEAVLEYLRKKGMASAANELSHRLDNEQQDSSSPKSTRHEDSADNTKEKDGLKDQMDEDDRKGVLTKATGGGFGYDRDAAAPVVQWGVPDRISGSQASTKEGLAERMGVEEAQSLLDAFTSFQLWVLSLPEHDGLQTTENPMLKAQQLIKGNPGVSLTTIVESLTNRSPEIQETAADGQLQFNLPPSAKPELFAVSFALLVHTYCELLEVGMEGTAHVLRDTFKSVYEPLYTREFSDLYHCNTTEDMMRLNSHNAQHMEALGNLKGILVQVASYQLKRDELKGAAADTMDAATSAARSAKLQEYDRTISMLQQKYNELSQRASMAFHKMHDLPFLRRARAVRWQLSMSTATYGLLASFLNANDTSLLAMSTLLQTKCELHVERRDPLPFTPACVLDDNMEKDGEATVALNKTSVSWAAPMPRQQTDFFIAGKLPFPRYHLDAEYDDENKAKEDKRAVEFNRALLVNGFRRLEALERKHEYEVLPKMKIAKEDYHHYASSRETANALEPTILISTLCSTASSSSGRTLQTGNRNAFSDTTAIWEESGIGLCCAKICPPDGRQVAVGCDDAAVRIWNLIDGRRGKEPAQVLLGHKNGFPVFDVSWNRDGRSLLSAGGDGSVRLWDTRGVGAFGKTATLKPSSAKRSSSAAVKPAGATELDEMSVPGLKIEDSEHVGGAALAVYRGHAPSTPVWSVSMAPCGYYFASAGADATARLWTTDREVPVRLFTGHTSMTVNCVAWHPNCNYVITGSDDKTARLWDIHSGRTVRLLNGCAAGVNVVRISPCGRYAAGGDNDGAIHFWDIGSGKKVTQFLPAKSSRDEKGPTKSSKPVNMVHSLSFSACGSGLASGGDDCCVRIWDVRREAIADSPVIESPAKTFATRQTIIMDLSYNKRNLLLSVGKYVTPVPRPVVI